MIRTGVCRDFAHLSVAFCRCMNIPARYCTDYLGDIGVPVSDALIARGRDAADVASSTTFGPNTLSGFTVVTEEITTLKSE